MRRTVEQNLRTYHAPVKRKYGSLSIRRASGLKSRKFERTIRKALERRRNSEYALRGLSCYETHRAEIVRKKLEKDFPGVPITIDVEDPSNWSELLKNYQRKRGGRTLFAKLNSAE